MRVDQIASTSRRPTDAEASHISTASVFPGMRAGRGNTKLALVAVLFLACVIVYVIRYVPATGNGSDFQVFYAAGYATAHHIDPFDWPALWRVEQIIFNGGIGHTAPFAFAPYADMPPWARVLQPFTIMSEADAYRLWACALLGLAAIGGYLALSHWPRRSRLLGASAISLCPAALFDTRLGQNSLFLVFVFGVALYLVQRRMPIAAGACMALGMYKPHLTVPVAVITVLSAPTEVRRDMLVGLVSGCIAFVGGGIFFDGGFTAYQHWLGSVHSFGASIGGQPDLASIPGMYLAHVGATTGWVLNAACLLIAAVIIYLFHISVKSVDEGVRWKMLCGGTAAYLALSPYVHTSDQSLLALPLVLLIRPNGSGLRESAVLLAVVSAILAPMVVLTDYHTVGINALPPIFALIAFSMTGAMTIRAQHQDQSQTQVGHEPAIGPGYG
jgi:Glycosyltransferase family 87